MQYTVDDFIKSRPKLSQTTMFAKNTQAYDLHTHSSASDGYFRPDELVQAAYASGVRYLALSDHDTLQGYYQAKDYLSKNSYELELIPAVEFSSRWNLQKQENKTDDGSGMTVHIVALKIDPTHPDISKLINTTQAAREDRNARIQHKFIKKGWSDVFDLAQELAGDGQLTRSHLASAMLQSNKISNKGAAFKRYLGNGKPLAAHTAWPRIQQTISAIKSAGGSAVLAHPLHYHLTNKKLSQLVQDFKQAGGSALEVITGNPGKQAIESLTGLALRHNLAASVGSDFHSPEQSRSGLGVQAALSDALTPIWSIW